MQKFNTIVINPYVVDTNEIIGTGKVSFDLNEHFPKGSILLSQDTGCTVLGSDYSLPPSTVSLIDPNPALPFRSEMNFYEPNELEPKTGLLFWLSYILKHQSTLIDFIRDIHASSYKLHKKNYQGKVIYEKAHTSHKWAADSLHTDVKNVPDSVLHSVTKVSAGWIDGLDREFSSFSPWKKTFSKIKYIFEKGKVYPLNGNTPPSSDTAVELVMYTTIGYILGLENLVRETIQYNKPSSVVLLMLYHAGLIDEEDIASPLSSVYQTLVEDTVFFNQYHHPSLCSAPRHWALYYQKGAPQ